jgi:hypothetical protein
MGCGPLTIAVTALITLPLAQTQTRGIQDSFLQYTNSIVALLFQLALHLCEDAFMPVCCLAPGP